MAAQTFRILSIDGGGIRGLIPALVLAEIEKRTGKAAHELFDLVAGTSTGGIISLGVTIPGSENRGARFSAAKLAAIRLKMPGAGGSSAGPGPSLISSCRAFRRAYTTR